MQPVSTLSLSDRVVSKCQLVGCDLKLVITPLGLCLQWISSRDNTKNKIESLGAVVVTKNKTGGKLYPVCMNLVTEVAVFGKTVSSGSRESYVRTPSAVLIVCTSGSVMAAHSKLPGYLVTLCHLAQPVVWAGIVEVGDSSAIVVVGKEALMAIGRPTPSSGLHASIKRDGTNNKGSLVWHLEALSTLALTCYGQNNALVFSDGISCWLCHVYFVRDQTEVKCHELPYCGVIKITCKDVDLVEMLTCDGRMYRCSWKVLTAGSKSDNHKVNFRLIDSELPHTIEGMMTGIQHCSELMDAEGKRICTLDLYLRQLSLAHRLLAEPQLPLFSTSVRVEHNIEERSSYLANIQFRKQRTNIDLDGKWWRLCLVIPRSNGDHFISAKLDKDCFKTDMCMSVALPPLNLNKSLGSKSIQCYLVLEHFSSFRPICQVFACETKIDIFHFVTCQRNLTTANLSSQNPSIVFRKILDEKAYASSKSIINKGPTPFCKVSTSCITHEKITSLFGDLLSFIPPPCSEDTNGEKTLHKISLWYHDDCIDVQCSTKGSHTCLSLEGPNPSVVLSLKAALERRVTELELPSTPVTLTPAVLRQAHLVYRILNFEANSSTTPASLSHLHHTTTQLMSLLPL
ncbi:uncharacterized protein [Procambarus clarkii]|uniref:uncharacterized protein n=1 Tax=Procambarus clarkii TaxID=6728 RepID=UPI0037438661